jgi:mannose-6-phosphate isomerase
MGDTNPVLNGPLAGQPLGQLAAAHPNLMLGSAALATGRADLPLLFKILDAQDSLSIQVHPDDSYAREVEQEPAGKTEAWYCLDAEPGAYVIHGFTRQITPAEIRAGLADGSIERALRKVPLRPGDAIFVPAGTVHAIGGGLLLGEIQQNSDTTYRLYDWGRPREMHIQQGLTVLDPNPPGFAVSNPLTTHHDSSTVRYLLACRYFAYRQLTVRGQLHLQTQGRSFQSLFCYEGTGQIRYSEYNNSGPKSGHTLAFAHGQTIFVPAALGAFTLEGDNCRLLNSFVPDLGEDVLSPLRQAGHSPASIAALGGPPGNDLEQLITGQ